MADPKMKHVELTRDRAKRYRALFGGAPDMMYPFHSFDDGPDAYLIDVFVYSLEMPELSGRVVAAVTNGMSDYPMAGTGERHELIQYLRECDEDHAARLYDLAWLPLEDGYALNPLDTIQLPDAVVEESDLKNAFFPPPLVRPHREFSMMVDGSPTTLLWHVPISDAELAYKKKKGANALLAKMQEAQLPLVFDEAERHDIL